MSRLAARGDMAGFGRTVDTGIRQIGFLLVPAGLVSAVLAEPITRLVYERGEFTAEQTPVVAGALAAFTVGLVFNGWMLLLNRAFYGLQSNWIPTLVALGNLVLNVLLFVAFYRLGVWGLPLAVSLSNLAGAVALAALMWKRVGGVELGATLSALARIIVASVVASGLAVAVWWAIDAALGRSTVAQILSVGLALGLGTAAYLGSCRLLGVRELGSLLALRRGG
jgi:putative peptidoglycan lipid II flippase